MDKGLSRQLDCMNGQFGRESHKHLKNAMDFYCGGVTKAGMELPFFFWLCCYFARSNNQLFDESPVAILYALAACCWTPLARRDDDVQRFFFFVFGSLSNGLICEIFYFRCDCVTCPLFYCMN